MAFEHAQKILAKIIADNHPDNFGRIRSLRPLPQYNPIGNRDLIPDISTINSLPGSPQRSQTDAASYIFRHASLGKGAAGTASGQTLESMQEDEDPSILTRLFDTLQIPLNFGLNAVKNMDEVALGKETLGQGLADQFHEAATIPARLVDNLLWKPNIPFTDIDEKAFQTADKFADTANRTTGQSLLQSIFPNLQTENKGGLPGAAGLGLPIDLIADPLNFVGVGAVGKAASLAEAGSAARKLEVAAAAREGTADATSIGRRLGLNRPGSIINKKFVPSGPARNGIPTFRAPVAQEVLGAGGPSFKVGGVEKAPRPVGLSATQKFRFDPLAGKAGIPRLPRVRVPNVERKPENLDLGLGRITPHLESAAVSEPFDADTAKILEDIRAGRISGKPPKVSRATQAKLVGTGTRLQDALLASKGTVRSGKGFTSATAIDKVIDGIRAKEIPRHVEVDPIADPILHRSLTSQADQFAKNLTRVQPNKQVELYSQIFNNVKKFVPKVKGSTKAENLARHKALALSALRSAEDHLINIGKNPSYWTGHQVRLSEVLAETRGIDTELVLREFQKKAIDSPIVQDAVNKALARRSMTTGTALRDLAKSVADAKNTIHRTTYSTRGEQAARTVVRDALRDIKNNSKFTPEELSAVKDVLQKTIDVDKLPSDVVLTDAGPLLVRAVASGKVDAHVIAKELKAIHKAIPGGPLPNELEQIQGKGVVAAIMMRTATWWGRPDIAKVESDVFGHGLANARMNGTTLGRMVKQFTKDERAEAWSVATGKETASTSRVFGLAGNMQRQMEHMFGSSGLREELGSDSLEMTVADKSQLAMHDINTELDRIGVGQYFKFTNKNLTRLGGKDYSQGHAWLHSWEESNPPNPAAFLYDVNLAMERVTKKYAFYDELAARFGSRRKGVSMFGGKAEHPVPMARLDGWYFSEDIKNQILATEESFKNPQWRTPNGFHTFAKAQRVWKIGMTIYNPIHHVRNLIGDSWLMWMAGINDPRVFIKSMRILHTQRARYEGILRSIDAADPQSLDRAYQELGPLYSRQAVEWSNTRRSDIISQIRRKGKTTNVTAEEYWQQAHKFNLLPSASESEDIFGETPFGKIAELGPVAKIHSNVTRFAEVREHFVRMAHFTGETEKGLKKGLTKVEAFEEAARATRKWHPDGRDLTNYERNIRLIIPFYSWLRKSTPLVLQSIVQRPSKVMAYPRIETAVSNMMGQDTSIEDPFPDDQLFPDWLRATGMPVIGQAQDTGLSGLIGNLATAGHNAYTGKPEGYAQVNPGNPLNDFFSQYGGTGRPTDPLRGLAEGLSPFLKVPIELAMGQKFTGQPIETDPSGYIGENIPFAAPATRIFNFGPLGDTAQAERDDTNFDKEALINWLTGLGLRGTGPYRNSAEFDAKDRAARFAKRRLYSNQSKGTP